MTDYRYLGMRDGDLDGKPYAKYWNPEMQPLSKRACDAVAAGPLASNELLAFTQVSQVSVTDGPMCRNGYGFLDDGSVHIAIVTEMPAVSPVMIDWWFAWHSDEPQRYKLWHPNAHVHAAWGDGRESAAITIANAREQYVGRPSHVWEYIGPQLGYYRINFISPESLNIASVQVREEATAVCARVGFAQFPLDFGYLVHYVQRTANGARMYSHFWIAGPHIKAREPMLMPLVPIISAVKRPSRVDAERLLIHCAEEMAHLSTFLPELFTECAR